MPAIIDADRRAAQDLRVVLADICGFWHQLGDDSPLCLALARHRQEAEVRMTDKLVPLFTAAMPGDEAFAADRGRPPLTLPRGNGVKRADEDLHRSVAAVARSAG